MWYGRKPDLSNLKVFGCVAYALVPAAKRRKFGDWAEKMRFLGYHKGHRGYRLMERGGNRVFYRTDVTFDEHNFRLTPEEDERRVTEIPSVEIDVCSSGRRAGKPAPEVPVAVPDREDEPNDPGEGEVHVRACRATILTVGGSCEHCDVRVQ